MMETDLLQYLAAGGDVGVWALVFLFWRYERRLTALEFGFKFLREQWATFGPHFGKTTAENRN